MYVTKYTIIACFGTNLHFTDLFVDEYMIISVIILVIYQFSAEKTAKISNPDLFGKNVTYPDHRRCFREDKKDSCFISMLKYTTGYFQYVLPSLTTGLWVHRVSQDHLHIYPEDHTMCLINCECTLPN